MMVRYIIANAASGEIVRVVRCLEDQAEAQAHDGEVLIEDADAAPATHYLDAEGALVAYTAEQAEAKAQRPAWATGWDNAAMAWTDPRTLADHKAAKWADIKAAREAAEYSLFAWDGSTFDGDAESQRRIQGASQLAMIAASAQQAFSIDWTLADNTVRTLSGAEMIAVGLALGTHVATQHVIARGLRAAIEAATDAEELETINWPSP